MIRMQIPRQVRFVWPQDFLTEQTKRSRKERRQRGGSDGCATTTTTMSSRVWDGHAELRDALKGLACAKGTSATRIKTVVNAALKYVKVRLGSHTLAVRALRLCMCAGVARQRYQRRWQRSLTCTRASVSYTDRTTSASCMTSRCFCGKPTWSTDSQVRSCSPSLSLACSLLTQDVMVANRTLRS